MRKNREIRTWKHSRQVLCMQSAIMVEIALVDAGSNGSIIFKRCRCEDY